VTVDDDGYYRLIVGNSDVINCTNCVAVSDEIFLDAKDCSVKITIEGDTLVCLNRSYRLTAKYSNADSPFGNNIFYRWEFKPVDSDTWTILKENQDAAIPLNVEWSIDNVSKSDEGLYRLRIGKSGTADKVNCCTVSDSIRLRTTDVIKFPDIRIQLSPMPDRTVYLTSFIDSIARTSIRWERATMYAPAIIAGTDKTTGSLNTGNFVKSNIYTYKYIATSQCGSSEARVYIRTVKDRLFKIADTVMICKNNKLSKSLNLNHILGLELDGEWKYDATINPDATVLNNVTVKPSTSKHRSALIFDAVNAYEIAPVSYSKIYREHNDAKIFKFAYNASLEANVSIRKILVIVVTGS
jgi:hypothetical protein